MRSVDLASVATIERKGVDPRLIAPDTPYIGLEHIERGGRIIGRESVGKAALASTKFVFSKEHLLYGKLRPNLGKISRPDFSGVCSTDILPIRPGKDLDRDYLAHYLAQPALIDFAASRTSGANLPRLSPAVLATFPIPLPPLAEQRRIAAILDRADAIRTKRRQIATLLDSFPGTIFDQMFSGVFLEEEKLAEVATVTSGITKGRRTTAPTNPTPYLAVANVQAGWLDLDTVKTIDATDTERDRYALRAGDVVLTEGGDPDKLGRGTVWRAELPLCLHQNHIFRVRPNQTRILPEYLAVFIASRRARAYFLRSAKQTTGIASINMTQLRALTIPVPSLQLQQAFVERLLKVRQARSRYERALIAGDELFASLQSRAFRGEL